MALTKHLGGNERSNWRVLIPDGDSPFALLVAQSLKRGDPSIRVHTMHVDPHALTRFSRYVDRCFPLSATNTVEDLCKHLQHQSYDLVLPVSGPGISFIAAHGANIGALARIALIPTSSQLEMANDKWAFFQAMHKAGVPVPPTVLVDSATCTEQMPQDTPFMLKPRSGSGGQGIVKFTDAAEFRLRAHDFMGPDNPYIMQPYIEGYDMGRSLLARGGRTLAGTIQKPTRRGFRPTGALHFMHDSAAETVADQVAAALDWNGVAHVDLRYDIRTSRPVVIEMNARYWSSMMGSLVAGVNFPLEQVRASIPGSNATSPHPKDAHYVKITAWPSYFLKYGTPLSQSNLAFNLADPLAKCMKWMRPSKSMGRGGA